MIEFDAELKQAEGKYATGVDVAPEILGRSSTGCHTAVGTPT
jgi:hypothetical protein